MEYQRYRLSDYYPKHVYNRNQTIPENVDKDLYEAKKCYENNCFKASVAMSRRTMQDICKNKGAKKGDLQDQINEIVPPDLKGYSHEIRHWGNIGVHPDDDIEDVKPEDARTMLEFIDLLKKAMAHT